MRETGTWSNGSDNMKCCFIRKKPKLGIEWFDENWFSHLILSLDSPHFSNLAAKSWWSAQSIWWAKKKKRKIHLNPFWSIYRLSCRWSFIRAALKSLLHAARKVLNLLNTSFSWQINLASKANMQSVLP